jgi:hypothetical protein
MRGCPWEGPSLQAVTHRTDSQLVRGGFGCLKGVLRRVEPVSVHERLSMGGPLTASFHI